MAENYDHSEKVPLYSDTSVESASTAGDDESLSSDHQTYTSHRRWFSKTRAAVLVCYLTVFSVSLMAAFVGGVAFSARSDRLARLATRAYSPVSGALVPELQMFNLVERTNSYINLPSPELDQAWRELLQYSNVRLTEAEVDAIDPTRKASSIPLPDGGYFGMLTVHHELHCVKHLHRFVYANHYFGNLTPDELARRQLHMEHCLDLIRQSIMCHADVQPITMRWAESVPVPGANYSTPHNCYNWDAVNNWAKGRSLDRIFEPGYLKHPTFGDVYSWEGLDSLMKVGLAVDHKDTGAKGEEENGKMSG